VIDPVTQQDVDDCNDDRARDGDPPVTAEQIQQVREQTPEE
jgi:hypothetical protein